MLTRLPPWYQPWKRWRTKVVFNPQIFRTDLERVQTALRESGHFQAVVTHEEGHFFGLSHDPIYQAGPTAYPITSPTWK